jgi:hypothetical protein
MARKPSLRAVEAGESAPQRKTHTVSSAASEGDRRDLLVAMRSRIATAVEDPNTPARDLAALTRRLMEIAKDIEAIDARAAEEAEDAGTTADEHWEAI